MSYLCAFHRKCSLLLSMQPVCSQADLNCEERVGELDPEWDVRVYFGAMGIAVGTVAMEHKRERMECLVKQECGKLIGIEK